MKILSVNAGSSSLKFSAYEMPEESLLISGYFERIGLENSFYTIKINGKKIKKEIEIPNHIKAFELLVEELITNQIVKSLEEMKGVGHRIVQGGSYFDKSVVATPEVIEKIEELSSLAPLHNPAAIVGIKAAQEVMKNATQVVVFDTAYHQTMDEVEYMYAVPFEWYTKYQVRKYGAHGTSHKYVAEKLSQILGTKENKLIVCHIGNGASITAIKNGKVVDTSMGLTPNAGLMMGSRCGDIDATIVTYMMEKTNMTPKEMDTMLNKESGLLGISGVSGDSRDIEEGIEQGNKRCILAQQMFVKRIVEYIAKYYVLLKGCDAIAITAGIGENSRTTRAQILEQLEVLGIQLDKEKNNKIASYLEQNEGIITTESSKIPVYVIPTNEEVMIAKDTMELL